MTFAEVLSALAEHAAVLWPFRIVGAWQQGVRTFCGRIEGRCTHENGLRGTGLHVFWPVLGNIMVQDANVEIAETQDLTLTTADFVAVTVGMSAQFRIADMAALWTAIHDHEATIKNAIEQAVGEHVRDCVWGEDFEATLVDKVAREMTHTLQGWGVNLENLEMRTCVQVSAHRVFGDVSRPRTEETV